MLGACRVELHVHHPVHQVNHVNVETEVQQAARRFQPEQPAADDRRAAGASGALADLLAVVECSEDEGARSQPAVIGAQPGDGRDERPAAGGEHEHVEGDAQVAAGRHATRGQVDMVHPRAGVERHAVGGIPLDRVDRDVARVVGPGQDAREQDAVVVAVRFVTEDGDIEPLAAASGQQVFDESGAGHAVADDDESSFGGQGRSSLPQGETRTAQTLNSGIRLIGSSASLVRRLTGSSVCP